MRIIKKVRAKFAMVLIGALTVFAPVGIASAGTVSATSTGPFPFTVGAGTGYPAGQWYLNFNGQYPTIDKVCATFGFGGNLLNPGERFSAGVAGAPSQTLSNTGSTSISSSTVCLTDSTSLSRFADGADVFRLTAVSGSVTVVSVSGQLSYR